MQTNLTTASDLLALLPRVSHYSLVSNSMPLGSGPAQVCTEPNIGEPRNALGSVFLTVNSPTGLRFRFISLHATHAQGYTETLTIVARAAHPSILCDRADIPTRESDFYIELTLV